MPPAAGQSWHKRIIRPINETGRHTVPLAVNERGASNVEMALILVLVAVVAVVALTGIGRSVGGEDSDTASEALGYSDPVSIDGSTERTETAANGAGGRSGVIGNAAATSSGGSSQGASGAAGSTAFEIDDEDDGVWNTHRTGESFGGWTVVSGTIDATVNYRGPFDLDNASNFIDMNGWGAGHIERTVDVIPGQTYNLSVDLGENSYGGPAAKTLEIIWNGEVVSVLKVDLPRDETRTFTVKLPSSTTGEATLGFASKNTSAHGVLLDNPTLTLIPT